MRIGVGPDGTAIDSKSMMTGFDSLHPCKLDEKNILKRLQLYSEEFGQ